MQSFYLFVVLFRVHRAAAGASKPRRTIEKFSRLRHSRNFRSKNRLLDTPPSIYQITFHLSAKRSSQRTIFQLFPPEPRYSHCSEASFSWNNFLPEQVGEFLRENIYSTYFSTLIKINLSRFTGRSFKLNYILAILLEM